MYDSKGQTALVTGAATGSGRAIAERFAGEGAAVVLVDIDSAGLTDAVARLRSLGATAHAMVADVGLASEVQRAVDEGEPQCGSQFNRRRKVS